MCNLPDEVDAMCNLPDEVDAMCNLPDEGKLLPLTATTRGDTVFAISASDMETAAVA